MPVTVSIRRRLDRSSRGVAEHDVAGCVLQVRPHEPLVLLEVDLAGVDFVDSSGLRVLIDAHQQAEGNGTAMRLANPSPAVRRLLEISGVDDYLNIV